MLFGIVTELQFQDTWALKLAHPVISGNAYDAFPKMKLFALVWLCPEFLTNGTLAGEISVGSKEDLDFCISWNCDWSWAFPLG